MNRLERKKAIAALLQSGRGTLEALEDLLNWELGAAREEMETARDNISIWRCQGGCAAIRGLLEAIRRKDGQ